MCGIFGVCTLDQRTAEGYTGLVEKGVGLLRHRGPDDHGVVVSGTACFGHSRLSIIDLEGGHQPMWSTDKKGLISYNGEVYNFIELKQALLERGYTFSTRSDTEVVLNAYLEWGTDCVSHFRGMFAFAALDLEKGKVILARDRLGIKPLFYTIKNGTLCFSSELEPLYRTAGPFGMDMESLDDYLYWQYIHSPRTIYRDVRSLPPAHVLVIDLATGQLSEHQYWKITFTEDRSMSAEDWEHRLDGLMREAVGIRLMSDVPFGAFLSGGIDSSLVTGYMADIMDQPVKTFSIGFKESDFSELEFARTVAELNHTDHHTEIVEAESLNLLPLLVRHYGQPFADSSAIPTFYVSKMARTHVKMVLSGDGGDENFAGYLSYETIMREMDRTWDTGGMKFRRRMMSLGYYYYWLFRQLAGLGGEVDKAYELHCITARHFSPAERRKLFRKEFRMIVRSHVPERRALMDIGDQPLISRLQHLDLMAYLPFDILTKVDSVSMANSLEVRVPLLDHKLVEAAATLPAEFKLREEKFNKTVTYDKKHILKNIARNRYPAEIIDRRKMGFGVPLGIWFATRLKNDIRKKLCESDVLPAFFNMKHIEHIVSEHSEQKDRSVQLWNLLFLEEWMKSHHEALHI